jgi:hypothetical protein
MDGVTDVMTSAETAAAESAPAPRPARHGLRRAIPLALVGVMSAAAAGAAVLAVGTTQSADAAVASAVTSTLNDRTADFTLSGAAGISKLSIPINGSGAIDFTQNAMQMQLTIPVPGGSQSVSEKAIYLNKVIYVNVSGLGQSLPGKSWISMNASQASGNGSATQQLGLGDGALPSDPEAMLTLLSQGGGQATDLGPSTVNGQAVEGYSVTIGSAALQKAMAQTKLPSLPSSLGSLGLGSSLIGGSSHIGYQVFITKATGQLSRVITTVGLSIVGQTITDNMTMDFTNLGAPVDITPPPASEVVPYQQFLQQQTKSASGSTV